MLRLQSNKKADDLTYVASAREKKSRHGRLLPLPKAPLSCRTNQKRCTFGCFIRTTIKRDYHGYKKVKKQDDEVESFKRCG